MEKTGNEKYNPAFCKFNGMDWLKKRVKYKISENESNVWKIVRLME